MPNCTWIDELDRLSTMAGAGLKLQRDASLSRCTTLRIGGEAQALVDVATEDSLLALLELRRSQGFALEILGKGANVLCPDEGFEGVVCRLTGDFKQFSIDGRVARAGTGVVLAQLARRCAQQGLVGLESLAGFPATVGGAVTMNAGCYGTEISDVLIDVDVLWPRRDCSTDNGPAGGPLDFERRTLVTEQLEAGYRTTLLKSSGAVVLSARFRLELGQAEAALERLDDLNRKRWASLPSGKPNAGSIFRNPPGDYAGRLLDEAGVKGLRIGDAAFSDKHANVIVNLGEASANDVVAIMRAARDRVAQQSGVELVPELILWGQLADSYEAGMRELGLKDR